MIEFKKEWTDGLDGGEKIATFVNVHVSALVDSDDVEVNGPGDAVDLALAAVMKESDTTKDALDNLDYVIRELQIARTNLAKEVAQ